jgi:nitrate reductase gamma subunit
LAGSLALLARRTLNPDYREFTTRADYFNLIFFVATFGVALAAHLAGDPGFSALRGYFALLVTFGFASADTSFAGTGGLIAAEIVLASLMLAYIPLTHMSHFFTKWFLYHHVRWSDEPNVKGGEMEGEIGKALEYPVSWSAPHIRGDGKKNWVDVATSDVEEDKE